MTGVRRVLDNAAHRALARRIDPRSALVWLARHQTDTTT